MRSIVIDPYYHSRQKRLFDICLSIFLILVLSPAFVVLSLLVLLTLGWPVLFVQLRQGKGKQQFRLCKFRTMITTAAVWKSLLRKGNEAPEPMFKMQNDPRFVGIGRWLSRSGLDELPQLFNILRGNMSFVGPRPLPVEEAAALPASWEFRYQVRPGLVSEWVLSEKKYGSLRDWQGAEIETLRFKNLQRDLLLLIKVGWKVLSS
ncbi:MAG: sugar transferase [bacterium]|nr:sugar transferase [bacterium]